MATKKISDLTAAILAGGELVPVVQGGTTKRASVGQGVGQLPYITTGGMVLAHNGTYSALNTFISPANGTGTWVRIATITLGATFLGAKLTFIIDRAGGDTWTPSVVYVATWRTNAAVPPVAVASLGVEPLYQGVGIPVVTDAALVETSPGVVELWVSRPADSAALLAVHVIGSCNDTIVLDSGTVTRYTAPPAPTTGGANVRWSSATSRLHGGRIVAVGSGANGSYVRFSDGTQIAQHTIGNASFGAQTGSGTFTDPYQRSVTWTYPVAFTAAPVVEVTPESTAAGIIVPRVTSVSATSAGIQVGYAASGIGFTTHLLAIGRWY